MGIYDVLVTITDPNYDGVVASDLIIHPADPNLTFDLSTLPGVTFGDPDFTILPPPHMAQGCLYGGTLSRMRAAPNGDLIELACGRGEMVALYQGTDLWACIYAGALSQVGPTEPANCGRGEPISFAAGKDLWGCLHVGTLSQVGPNPPNCSRGVLVGFRQVAPDR